MIYTKKLNHFSVDHIYIMHDISYINWVGKDENIKKLCTPFEVVLTYDNNNN